MFGSTNSFGQSSSSPFGSQSVFGSNNASNNPFAPKPFGSTSPFGSQTGGSLFGGTSTGVFGATQSSSPMPSTPTFGSSSTPAFGSSVPAFGASSAPAFGSGSSPFGGSSAFGQKPAFGGFGSTPSQASPFGNTFQQTQSAFGSNLFGSSAPFGASSQPAFGSTSAPAFGMTSTPAFGATSQPFGATSTPAFGSTTTPAFGSSSTSAFGSTGTGAPAFGSGGAFGASSSPAFGSSTTSGFGASSTPAFGSSSTPLFGASSSAFGASSSPSFSFGSSPSFGQSNSAFGSSPFGTTPSPFGAQSSSFGSQVATPSFGSSAFGQSTFGGQRGGSRVAAYSPTAEVDGGSSTQPAGKLESISAMNVYKEKSHEELRWEDYQLGDKGGPNPATQPAGFGTPAAQSNPFGGTNTSNPFGGSSTSNTFGGTNTFGNPSTNPFSSSTSSNPFGAKPSTFGTSGFGTSSTPNFTSSPFGSSSSANPFGTNSSSTTPSLFTTSTSAFGSSSSPSLFAVPSSSSAFGSSPSIFGSTSASGTTSPFPSAFNTQSAGLFQSTTPSLGQTTSPFGQTSSAFGQSTPSFGQTNMFSTPTTGFGFPSSSTPSLLPTNNQTAFPNPFQTAQPAQTAGAFSFNNFGQTQTASNGFGSMPGGFGQGTFGQSQSPVVMQPPPVSNPFGTLPAMPQMSIGRSGSPTVQYGISSMPVTEKPNPIRVSSLLTSRHISQRRNNSATRKYHPKNDGPKVPFYYDDEAPSNPKADALFIPRENPRSLVIGPREKWPSKASLEKPSQLKDTDPVHKNDCLAENGSDRERIHLAEDKQRANGVHEDKSTQKPDSYITQNGHRSGDAASVHEHGTEIESVLPKLKHADYYTEPQIQELAAKERAEPGFCRHVKGFVVGRHGYGSIKFFGETDVRGLDLESIVQFNNREVIVYMDDSKKPPVGQGLNKPAEVTLLNVKCLDKKTGKQCTEGLKVEKYRDMLMKKAHDQGVEFISYDPRKGEWKFKVNHFSSYGLDVEDEDV